MANRFYARFPCREEVTIKQKGLFKKDLKGEIRDVSIGGALLAVKSEIKEAAVELVFQYKEGEELMVPSKIARRLKSNPNEPGVNLYGITFAPYFTETHKLREVINRLRSQGKK